MFRRRVIVSMRAGPDQAIARAALEDDYHHFRCEVASERGQVSAIQGTAVRHPYSMCAQATAPLLELLGTPLSPVAHGVNRLTDPTSQCTHLLELAGLAVAALARGTRLRRYDIEVPAWTAGRTAPGLRRDGAPLIDWQVDERSILGPAPYEGRPLYEGFAQWALAHLPQDEAEAALVLRRCTVIAKGRQYDLDAQAHASASGRCFSQQPTRALQAIRIVGSTQDFSRDPDSLCAADLSWLDFREPPLTA